MSSQAARICLIEDDEIMGEALADRFRLEGFECDWFRAGRPAVGSIGHKPYDAVICDIQLPDIDGEALFTELKARETRLPPFLFTTGYGTVDRAVRLLKLGAYDFITKPLDIHALLDSVREIGQRSAPPLPTDLRLGVSGAMRRIEALLPRLAHNRSAAVLITGESGVGKEEVARTLHCLSAGEQGAPFVAVNCGALTESLMEAELFGYLKGAYTGAVRDKKGYFEQAHGGTLFLDEIGEMSSAMQVKLLRAIQERRITRLGSETAVPVDIRLICATHQDLRKLVEQERFREDLYYRINTVHLHVAPLRERRDDILWLARRLLDEWSQANNDYRTLHPDAEKALIAHPWPGNVRELKHCLERACILAPERQLSADMLLEPEARAYPPMPADVGEETLSQHLAACERVFIEGRLKDHQWQIAETAEALGISRKNLWEKMKKLGIKARDEHSE